MFSYAVPELVVPLLLWCNKLTVWIWSILSLNSLQVILLYFSVKRPFFAKSLWLKTFIRWWTRTAIARISSFWPVCLAVCTWPNCNFYEYILCLSFLFTAAIQHAYNTCTIMNRLRAWSRLLHAKRKLRTGAEDSRETGSEIDRFVWGVSAGALAGRAHCHCRFWRRRRRRASGWWRSCTRAARSSCPMCLSCSSTASSGCTRRRCASTPTAFCTPPRTHRASRSPAVRLPTPSSKSPATYALLDAALGLLNQLCCSAPLLLLSLDEGGAALSGADNARLEGHGQSSAAQLPRGALLQADSKKRAEAAQPLQGLGLVFGSIPLICCLFVCSAAQFKFEGILCTGSGRSRLGNDRRPAGRPAARRRSGRRGSSRCSRSGRAVRSARVPRGGPLARRRAALYAAQPLRWGRRNRAFGMPHWRMTCFEKLVLVRMHTVLSVVLIFSGGFGTREEMCACGVERADGRWECLEASLAEDRCAPLVSGTIRFGDNPRTWTVLVEHTILYIQVRNFHKCTGTK